MNICMDQTPRFVTDANAKMKAATYVWGPWFFIHCISKDICYSPVYVWDPQLYPWHASRTLMHTAYILMPQFCPTARASAAAAMEMKCRRCRQTGIASCWADTQPYIISRTFLATRFLAKKLKIYISIKIFSSHSSRNAKKYEKKDDAGNSEPAAKGKAKAKTKGKGAVKEEANEEDEGEGTRKKRPRQNAGNQPASSRRRTK